MDTDSLSFGYEEHFPVFENSDFLNIDDESESMEEAFASSTNQNRWEWEVESELNGDVALIPVSSELGMDYLSNSPPIKEDFQKIMSEWQHFMNIEVPGIEEFNTDEPFLADGENVTYIADTTNPSVDALEVPITLQSSLNLIDSADPSGKKTSFKISRPSGKKIDMNAQCYIVEENEFITPKSEVISTDNVENDDYNRDDNDENTDDDSSNNNHCEDNVNDDGDMNDVDVKTCMKHEIEEVDIHNENINIFSKIKFETLEQPDENLSENPNKNQVDLENDYIDVDTIPKYDTPILQAGDLNSLLEQFEATETTQYFEPAAQPPIDEELFELQSTKQSLPCATHSEPSNSQVSTKIEPDSNNPAESDKNKQILDALPQELIMRIKASSKRKVIPVIDPIPNKRRNGAKKPQIEVPQTPQDKVEKQVNSEFIHLDHDYCSLITPYPKHPKKDSGFESAEEDEQRNILRNQPTVKGVNGKLMVSLLKINTIRNSVISENNKKKRKLNLEEYKKRREGFARSCDNSQSNSPIHSGRNSPLVIEDENMRLLKHQQKLMQMAAEVLKTPPKSALKPTSPTTIPSEELASPVISQEGFTIPSPPDNVEVKVLVSIGVNTESSDHGTVTSKQFEVPVTELENIKPLLESANAKINNNSLITSVIENIQNKKKTLDASTSAQDESNKQPKEQHHGEDKTIVYLDKGRPAVVTNSVQVQTDIIVETEMRRSKRRRSSSSSSNDHRKSCKRRSNSNDSHDSFSSQSSSTSTSRSRSRSSSPRRVYNRKRTNDTERERVREVEERRIVYVGGISPTMTKEALRRRFQQYGPISNVSVHFREYGDNYGFVTFLYKVDAYEAVEHGNDDPALPRYDLSFGGRRIFCRTHYADLDSVQDEMGYSVAQVEDSFDNLLREAQAKLRKRKSSYT